MHTIYDLVMTHKLAAGIGAFWIASNFVTALPSPSNTSNGFYKWFFGATHGIVGGLPRVIPALRIFDPTSSSGTYFAKPNGSTTPTPTGGQ